MVIGKVHYIRILYYFEKILKNKRPKQSDKRCKKLIQEKMESMELLESLHMNHVILLKTINFAAQKHTDQRRKNSTGSPYIEHPIAVANQISQIGHISDLATLQAAILHDTVEDTNTTLDEIKTEFGEEVSNIVAEVTDNKSLPKVERKKFQIVHAAVISYKAKIVKLSDKLHNLSDLLIDPPTSWSKETVQGYFIWSYQVVRNLKGTNIYLETALNDVFNNAKLPPESQHAELLEKYYQSMKSSRQ